MYKNLRIEGTVAQQLVLFRSLPTGSVMLTQNNVVFDVNTVAMDLFQIHGTKNPHLAIDKIMSQIGNLKDIITELKSGYDIINKEVTVRCPTGRVKRIRFNATMLSGAPVMFLFQFFEISQPRHSAKKSVS